MRPQVLLPAVAAAVLMEAKNKTVTVYGVLVHVKDPRVV